MLGIRRNLLSLLCAVIALFCVGHATDTTTLFFVIDSTATVTAAITPTVVSGASADDDDDGLSPAAVAGITVAAVCIVIGAAIAVGVIGYIVWSKKAAGGKITPE